MRLTSPALALLAGLLALLALAAPAGASRFQESTFQDDDLLVYGEPARVAETLDTLKALGVDRLRVSVFWKIVAPAFAEDTKPAGFDGGDPGAYPQGAWERYDRLAHEATARGLELNLNLTGPAPDWATGTPDRADLDETYEPSAAEFAAFTRAAGTRYSGTYSGPDGRTLPRIDYWSIWNEPNQAGWLTPQWVPDPRGKGMVEAAPRIYRELADEALLALRATGHGDDTILIGETAPKGLRVRGVARSMAPGRFIRRLFCLDDRGRTLKGTSAEVQGCPVSGAPADITAAHPSLLGASGWAHHPYELVAAPSRKPRTSGWYTIANLSDLQRLLRRSHARLGRNRAVPLYLTEFGYQTNPPDPLGVSQGKQAAYLAESEFRTYADPRVRTHSQFLLVDDEPLPGYPTTTTGAWGTTFQSGLRTLEGRAKPAFQAYQVPVFLPARSVRRGGRLRVWGLARAAAGRPLVEVLVRERGARRTRVARRVRGSGAGYVDTRIRVRRSGTVRLRWRHPDGRRRTSQAVPFTVRGR
ncbi:MAG TPA: hypothetical protein VD931_04200 [Baekduia sp.]|nr:hypothetical protein [Baekduia sp.]